MYRARITEYLARELEQILQRSFETRPTARPDPTAAARQRRWYARQKAGTPWQPLTCQACGGNSRGTHGELCSRCWERLTPEGRAAKAERVRLSRARRRALAESP